MVTFTSKNCEFLYIDKPDFQLSTFLIKRSGQGFSKICPNKNGPLPD